MLEDLDNANAIADAVERLLRRADINERLPTPVEDLVEAAGLQRSDEVLLTESRIAEAPRELRRLLRSAKRKVLGLLDRRERVIQVVPSTSTGRERFITCHEVSHDIFEWQRGLMVLGDTAETLSPAVTMMFEREANYGAAELLFQRDLLRRVAHDYPIDISTPAALSELFGGSFHASFRRWVEGLDAAACGLVLEPNVNRGRRRRYELVESAAWRQRFGERRFGTILGSNRYGFVERSDSVGVYVISDRDGDQVELNWQTLTTPYRRFVLLAAPSRESLVARFRRRPTVVTSAGS